VQIDQEQGIDQEDDERRVIAAMENMDNLSSTTKLQSKLDESLFPANKQDLRSNHESLCGNQKVIRNYQNLEH
jgi:hypothetical protein